jgi:hypothetical protein
MPFTLPLFNQLADVWLAGVDPTANPPTWINVPCQLYQTSRFLDNGNASYVMRMPKQAVPIILPLYNFKLTTYPNFVAVFFEAYQMRMIHRGFPNEYWGVACYTTQWVAGVSVPQEILA